jgi:glycosyltransferase involved in cell wall biosynthesis
MKILQIVPTYPPKVGGVESHVFELVGHLRKLGHTVYVMTSDLPHLKMATDSNLEMRLPLFYNISGKWGEIPICPSIFSKLAEVHPDVVHLHTPPRFFAESAAFYFRFLSQCRIPIIVTYHLHNASLKHLEKSVWWLHTRTLQRFVFNAASKVVLCNSQDTNLVRREFGIRQEKIAVIPPGVDCDKFDPRKVKGDLLLQKGIAAKKTILFSGRLNPVKGLNFLIKAFDIVLKRNKNVTLVICGAETGNYQHDLRMLAKNLNLSAKVVFIDPVSAESYPRLLAACDIFVLPSLAESWPISLAEALSMEKPVVATKVGGVKEIVHDNKTGLMVEPTDVTALANALIQLLENQSLANRLGKNGREFVVNNFDWNILATRFETLYKENLDHFTSNPSRALTA